VGLHRRSRQFLADWLSLLFRLRSLHVGRILRARVVRKKLQKFLRVKDGSNLPDLLILKLQRLFGINGVSGRRLLQMLLQVLRQVPVVLFIEDHSGSSLFLMDLVKSFLDLQDLEPQILFLFLPPSKFFLILLV